MIYIEDKAERKVVPVSEKQIKLVYADGNNRYRLVLETGSQLQYIKLEDPKEKMAPVFKKFIRVLHVYVNPDIFEKKERLSKNRVRVALKEFSIPAIII